MFTIRKIHTYHLLARLDYAQTKKANYRSYLEEET